MASITINNLHKSYHQVPVLKEINLAMADGEFVVLVGPSGCGKSTLLRTIAGLETITSGEIQIGDRRVNDVPPKDRDISMVFQSYALYPHMTVERNMGFSLELQKQPKEVIKAAVAKAAETLGLTHLLQRRPKELSGGQRQRVAMGRAIVRQPQVFLFDEPLSNLDAQLRVQMRVEIKALHQKMKTTVVYVTHDQVEAMTLADRIVVMNGGIIQQVGPPLELYDAPANVFVASFMGSPSMNFIAGTLCHQQGRQWLKTDNGSLLPVAQEYHQLEDGLEVIYGIRPESVSISEQVDPSCCIDATVTVVEPTGLSELIYCEVAGQQFCIYTMERPQCRAGDRINLHLDLSRMHLFDATSQQRIALGQCQTKPTAQSSSQPLGIETVLSASNG